MGDGVVIVGIMGAVAVTGIIAWAVVATASVWSRERSRRELMAYVAEGSVSPQDAAKLIELTEQSELRKKLVDVAANEWDIDSYHRTLDRVFEGKADPAKAAAKASAPA